MEGRRKRDGGRERGKLRGGGRERGEGWEERVNKNVHT